MVNTNSPHGLSPSHNMSAGCQVTNEYPIAPANNTPIYLGDPVVLNAGNVEQAAGAGVTNIGVFAGCQYLNAKGEITYSKFWTGEAGATKIKALVWDDPDQVFSIQTTTATKSQVGSAFDLSIVAGVPTIGLSKTVLDTAAQVGSAYKIVGFVNRDDNVEGAHAEVDVIAVKHGFASS
jgi:hypothetical protein